MSKPRKLSRPEIEGLAEVFGCRVTSRTRGSSMGTPTYDIYIVCKGKEERIGNIPTNNPIYLYWTNHDWTKAFQRISGVSGAELWSRPKPKS